MMKNYLFLFQIFILFIFTTCQNIQTDLKICKLETVNRINVKTLPLLLSNSLWKYKKSFTKDSCFYITNFNGIDFPSEVEWLKLRGNLELDTLNSIHLIRKTDIFKNLKANVKINAKLYETFPFCTNADIYNDEIIKLKVVHHSKPEEKVPKKLYYFIIQCEGDSMVLEDQKVYTINKIKHSGVRHLFLKENSAATRLDDK